MKTIWRNLSLLCLTLLLVGAGCGGNTQAQSLATKPVTLTIWRVFDDDSTYSGVMGAYQALHPNISFNYRELRYYQY